MESWVAFCVRRFATTLKLWRRPGDRTGGVPQEKKDYNMAHYHAVCGRICLIADEKHGVPYFDGFRYSIEWEDGLVEEALTAVELLNAYKNTPQSIGCNSKFDIPLVEDLLEIGKAAGEILEAQRIKDAVRNLESELNVPNLMDSDICERALDVINKVISGLRESHILAWNSETNEGSSIITRYPIIKARDRMLKHSKAQIVEAIMASPTPLVPIILDDGILEWVVVEMQVPGEYKWPKDIRYTRFFPTLLRYKQTNAALVVASKTFELDYFSKMVVAMGHSLGILFGKGARHRHRKELMVGIEAQLYEWRNLSTEEICANCIESASQVLPGASLYTALLEKGANRLIFTAASASSSMMGKTLPRGKGISFDVVESLTTILLKPDDADKAKLLKVGSMVEVKYGKVAFKAKISAVRGHEKYDVIYDDDKVKEAGVDISRITPVHSAYRTFKFGPTVLPFLSIPLRHRDKGIGVLNIENFSQVPHAPYDPQPELGLLQFLEKLGRILGTTIDTQRKRLAIKLLLKVARNLNAELMDVLEEVFAAISSTLYYVDCIVATRMIYEANEARSMRGTHVLLTQGDADATVLSRLNSYDRKRSNQKPFQQHNDRLVWLHCKLRPPVKGGEGKIFVVAISNRIPFHGPDLEFLATLQKILTQAIEGVHNRKAVGEIRFEALADIKKICMKYTKGMDRHQVFQSIVERVQTCFFSANMYVGRLGIHNHDLHYILASSLSKMKGQVLKRSMKDGISFNVIDTSSRMMVVPGSEIVNKLHHFGPKEQFEYPLVVVPICVHLDAITGVLAVDSCDDPFSESDRQDNIIGFFGTIASHISPVIRQLNAEDARKELMDISRRYKQLFIFDLASFFHQSNP